MRSGGNGVEISELPMRNRPAFTERLVFSERSVFTVPPRTCISTHTSTICQSNSSNERICFDDIEYVKGDQGLRVCK